MELGELEVGEHRSRLAGEQQARPEGAGRVGRARPQRGGAAGGEQRGLGLDRAAVLERNPAVFEDRGGPMAFQDLDAVVLDTVPESVRRIRRPVALPPAWMIRRRLWPPSRPSARSPRRSASNFTPSCCSSRTRAGASSVRTSAARCARQAPSSGERVLEVQLRGVVERERRGRPALRPVRGGLGQRPCRDERDASALAGGGQRGEQPGRAGADDDEVGSHTSTRYYGVRDGGELTPRALAAPRRCLRPRRARASGASGPDPGAGGRDERARLVRRGASGGASRSSAPCSSWCIPRRTSIRSRALCSAGGGAIDADTYAVPGTYGAALRACGGAVALVDALAGR